jgi:hypothetical protein
MEQAFVSLFVIIDPIGNILVFHLYSSHLGARQRLIAATIAVLAALPGPLPLSGCLVSPSCGWRRALRASSCSRLP